MQINDPEIVAELQALYPKYEAALMANDAETLTRMFWASPHAMRFGVTENLYGIEEIEAFRKRERLGSARVMALRHFAKERQLSCGRPLNPFVLAFSPCQT